MTRSHRASATAAPPADLAGESGTASAVAASYEEALAELERLVSSMESGQMPLDSLLVGYRRAAALLAFCRERLQAVEDQVRILEDGQLKTWSDEAIGTTGR
jgi:exodeoxyribonuclease VII small subunit